MKRIHQMLILIVFIFSSGFAAGIYYTNITDQGQPLKQSVPVSQSSKLLVKKGIPELSEIPEKVLMGYIQDYRDPKSIDYSNLTHILFSFAHPEKDGSISLNGDSALKNLRSVVRNAHRQDVKAILAVGGWFHINGGESYDYFK